MKAVGQYDGSLQMFVEEPRDVDPHRLSFLRWLVEHNRLEHPISGPSTGDYAIGVTAEAPVELPLAS
jgi:hypothetical protein